MINVLLSEATYLVAGLVLVAVTLAGFLVRFTTRARHPKVNTAASLIALCGLLSSVVAVSAGAFVSTAVAAEVREAVTTSQETDR